MIERGRKKEGKCIFFPQFVRIILIISPIDLKIYKIATKKTENFRLRRTSPHYQKIHLIYIKKGGGQKYELQI